MDPELLLGYGTQKIQSYIRIRNKSFRIRNTAFYSNKLWTIELELEPELEPEPEPPTWPAGAGARPEWNGSTTLHMGLTDENPVLPLEPYQ